MSVASRSISAIVFLTFAGSCAAASVKLANGSILETDLKVATLIAELKSDTGQVYALIAGRDCVECDENTSLYVADTHNTATVVAIWDKRNLYPGVLRDYETGEVIQKTRTFYGRCLNTPGDSVIWFVDYKTDKGPWSTAEDALSWVSNTAHHQLSKTDQPDKAYVLAAASQGQCHEIAGKDQYSEP